MDYIQFLLQILGLIDAIILALIPWIIIGQLSAIRRSSEETQKRMDIYLANIQRMLKQLTSD